MFSILMYTYIYFNRCCNWSNSNDLSYTWKGEKNMIYIELFLAFLQIGAFSFGGGYGRHAIDTGTSN